MSKFTNDIRNKFYLTFFEELEGYDEKEVNGYWLIKQFDGNTKKWVVHLYSPESYRNYKQGSSLFKENDERMDFINSI